MASTTTTNTTKTTPNAYNQTAGNLNANPATNTNGPPVARSCIARRDLSRLDACVSKFDLSHIDLRGTTDDAQPSQRSYIQAIKASDHFREIKKLRAQLVCCVENQEYDTRTIEESL